MSIHSKSLTYCENQINHLSNSNKGRILNFILAFCFFTFNATAQKTFEWPCFHGPNRTNKSAETGLMKHWPKEGPVLLWTASGLGEGYSSVSVAGGHLYTAGMYDGHTYVFCFDLDGKPVWKMPNGIAWSTTMPHARAYTGSRSTPTYDNGVIYHLGELGVITAFNALTGEEIWHKNLVYDFDAELPEYGYTESVLIDGDHLFVRPFGKKGFQVCLNKTNGALIWANTEISGKAGYSSVVITEFGGYRQIIGSSSDCYYSVDTQTGKLLWKVHVVNKQELNNTDAVVYNDYVFISSGYGKGSTLIKLKASGKGLVPETVWQSALMDNHHGGVILDKGYLYGAGSNSKGWFCLDFLTGKQLWKADGKGSVTFANDMLYLLDERGTLRLVRATPDKFEISGEFKVPEGGTGMYWAHPVICSGVLYVRHADKLFAYDIFERILNR